MIWHKWRVFIMKLGIFGDFLLLLIWESLRAVASFRLKISAKNYLCHRQALKSAGDLLGLDFDQIKHGINLTLGGKHFAKIGNSFLDLICCLSSCALGYQSFCTAFWTQFRDEKAHIKAGFGRKEKLGR